MTLYFCELYLTGQVDASSDLCRPHSSSYAWMPRWWSLGSVWTGQGRWTGRLGSTGRWQLEGGRRNGFCVLGILQSPDGTGGKQQGVKVCNCRVTAATRWDLVTQTHLVDHVQSALKDSVKDLGDFSRDVDSQLVDNRRHGAEDLGLSGGRDVPLVVDEHRLQQGGHKVLSHLDHRTYQYIDRSIIPIDMPAPLTTLDQTWNPKKPHSRWCKIISRYLT